jgi:hypothetical protein
VRPEGARLCSSRGFRPHLKVLGTQRRRCRSVCLFVYPSVCLSVCLFVCGSQPPANPALTARDRPARKKSARRAPLADAEVCPTEYRGVTRQRLTHKSIPSSLDTMEFATKYKKNPAWYPHSGCLGNRDRLANNPKRHTAPCTRRFGSRRLAPQSTHRVPHGVPYSRVDHRARVCVCVGGGGVIVFFCVFYVDPRVILDARKG